MQWEAAADHNKPVESDQTLHHALCDTPGTASANDVALRAVVTSPDDPEAALAAAASSGRRRRARRIDPPADQGLTGTAYGRGNVPLAKQASKGGYPARLLVVQTRRARGGEPGARLVYLSGRGDLCPVWGSLTGTGAVDGPPRPWHLRPHGG